MVTKLIPITLRDGTLRGYRFYCPACRELHPLYVAGPPPLWSFDGNFESPSFGPSLRMIGGNGFHLFLQQGQILYRPDSHPARAGKTVPMGYWVLERWCPQRTLHTLTGKRLQVQ